ncbi:MAG: DUF1987 domain-containing protein [Crocinitomicaceae bacterium]
MKTITINATHKTPEIKGDIETGHFSIKGKCIPEDARDFFDPFKDWFLELVKTDSQSICAELDLEYFNTSTSIILLDVFKKLRLLQKERDVRITWFYDVDDFEMEEVGQDYKVLVGDILELKPKNS